MTTKSGKLKPRALENISVLKFINDYIYRIDLDADYQREKIWSLKEQKELLDSIFKDIDIPKIYLVKIKENQQFDYECIDGKQRMSTLLRFFKPDQAGGESALTIRIAEEEFTYEELKDAHPTFAKKIEDYELSFCIYESLDDEYVRQIFRRLQLGVRLNSGELLKTKTGTIRDFIYKEIGNDGPFFRLTNLSEKRFSRPFTLAQICINSFAKTKSGGDFVRARLEDIEFFFEDNHNLEKNDKKLAHIRNVLKEMDRAFKEGAFSISSRAVAVTTYLFVEELYTKKKLSQISIFAKFYIELLSEIKLNTELLSKFEKPRNSVIMEEFQKYVLQASVEGYSIRRRHDFLKNAFEYYLNPKTKGKIVGSK